MKKRSARLLCLSILVCLLTACTATPVVYGGSCPDSQARQPADAVRTGLSLVASLDAAGEAATCDLQLVALTVDPDGTILSCAIDGMSAMLDPDAPSREVLPDAQRWLSLAANARGKTLSQLRQGDVAYPEAVLSAIEAAIQSAAYLGAGREDELRLACLGSSEGAAPEQPSAALSCDAIALTLRDGRISSCILDGIQAQAEFDPQGRLTSDPSKPLLSKNVLGDAYGMRAYGGAALEWRDQAAAFAAYLRGRSLQELAGVAVRDGRAADSDIASTVTISVGGFLRLAEAAMAA